MALSKHLAIDLGAESGRLIVGTIQDGKVSLQEVHRFTNRQVKIFNSTYWNVLSLFQEIKEGIRLTVNAGHGDIQSIGIDTWGVDFGLVGQNGELLTFPHTYRDGRTNGIPEKVFQIIPEEQVYKRTGIQMMQINSLYQLYSLLMQDESLLKKCSKLLFMPDLFNYLLTGEAFSEYTIASTSQMLNVGSKNFDKGLLSDLGIPTEIFASILQPGTVVGKLLPEIAIQTGIGEIDVIAVGSHDTASAVAAVPATGDNWAYLSSGTWSLIGIETEEPIIDPALRQSFTNEGGISGKYRFQSNTTGLWFIQEIRKCWAKQGESFNYDEINNLAAEASDSDTILDPDDKLFLNPPDMIEAIEKYCRKTNQIFPASKGELIRMVLKSLSHRYSRIIERIESVSGKCIETINIVGGGSQNDLLNQMTADSTGKIVKAGPVEATSLGNILIQAIAKGRLKSIDEAREMIANSFQLAIYNPAR